jgi:chitinase
MNYDIHGSWSPVVGANAPLNDTCASTHDGSAVSAVKAWSSAGFPVKQMILGVPAYSHSFFVTQSAALDKSGHLNLDPPFDASKQPAGDKWDSTPGSTDSCGNPTTTGGVFTFWGLVDAGFLTIKGNPSHGIHHLFDTCSQTVRTLHTHRSRG